MGRTVQALRICQKKIEKHGVRRMRLVATEACRRARNARDFIRQVRRETGLALEIIAPEEEARLAVISCAPLVSPRTEQLLVVDIGGGSTELVWIDLSGVAPDDRPRAIMRLHAGFQPQGDGAARVVDWISVPLGVATLKDQFHDVEDDAARFALMSWFFEENLANFSPYNAENPREGFQIIGTSGTVTTVAASFLGLRRYDRAKVDGLRMTSDQIDTVIRDYLSLGPEGRRTDPRIGRDRHALIMSGAAILQALMRIWPTDRLSVADRGLREGLLYAQMSADGVLEDGPYE
jgi:exopolyphosphatase/guanosine-5'-triphosphate,3'-diphosphate pyrophosphatase